MGHAILSPSASSRWSRCPASVRMSRDLPPQPESVYAREGTLFHTLCELSLKHHLGQTSEEEYALDLLDWMVECPDEWREDQFRHLGEWIEFVDSYLGEDPEATVYVEQVVQTGIPGCWGTADFSIVFTDGSLVVIDIKYGAGLKVSAVENSQLRLYGLGALNTLVSDPLTVPDVTMVVWQPRMSNISRETLTRQELYAWRDGLLPIAELALGEDGPFNPSEVACRFCPVAGECAPRAKYMLDQDFGDPDLMTGEEIADAFARAGELKQWVTDVQDAALKRAYETDGSVPGFKVVRSGGRRSIVDPEKAVSVLLEQGYPEDKVFSRKPATLGELEKLTGSADKLQEVLGGLLVKGEGRLSLVPNSDAREKADAVHSAESDFAEIEIEGDA